MSGPSRLPAARGAAWIIDGLRAARRAGGAYAIACLWVAAISLLPFVGLAVAALVPVFYAGLVTLLDTAARGAPVRPSTALAGFTAPGAFVRLLPLACVQAVLLVAMVVVVDRAAAPELAALAAAAKANAGGEPDPTLALALIGKLVPALLALAPLAIGTQWLLMLAVPRAMGGVPGGMALLEAVVGVWRNVGAFAVNLLCQVMLALALSLVLALLAALAAVLGPLGKSLLVVVCTAAALGFNAAMMARAAHEVFADEVSPGVPAAPPAGPDHIEA